MMVGAIIDAVQVEKDSMNAMKSALSPEIMHTTMTITKSKLALVSINVFQMVETPLNACRAAQKSKLAFRVLLGVIASVNVFPKYQSIFGIAYKAAQNAIIDVVKTVEVSLNAIAATQKKKNKLVEQTHGHVKRRNIDRWDQARNVILVGIM